jgi:hypothetical protein
MSSESHQNERKDFEVLCELLAATEFDMSEAIPAQQRDNVPVGSLVRDEVVREATELDFSFAAQKNGQPDQSTDSSPKQENPPVD